MNKNIQLIVIRHGKCVHNLGDEGDHKFAGSQIDNELAVEGIENAERLAERLKNQEIDLIVCSSLKRSKQTAEIIAKEISAPTQIIEGLKEINIGKFVGHTEEEVKKIYPESAKSFYDGDIKKWDFPQGENYQKVIERLKIAIEKIKLLAPEGGSVVISGHGMLNRVLFHHLKSETPSLWQPRVYPHDRIEEFSVNFESP